MATDFGLMGDSRTEPVEFRESHIRTILKTLSWRILATTTTVVIAYCVFGDISSALKVGGIEFFAKMLIYYFHERAWQLAPRGSVRTIISRKPNENLEAKNPNV